MTEPNTGQGKVKTAYCVKRQAREFLYGFHELVSFLCIHKEVKGCWKDSFILRSLFYLTKSVFPFSITGNRLDQFGAPHLADKFTGRRY